MDGYLRVLFAAVLRAVAQFAEVEENEAPSDDDQNKTFRTRLVVTWLTINAALCIAISRLPSEHRTIYFQVLLWMYVELHHYMIGCPRLTIACRTFGTSFARLLGFLWYMIGESLFRTSRLTARMMR